jgi:protein phosphatase
VFPENPAPHRVIPNQRVAFYYAAAAALSVALATILRPWGAILLWPAFAFGLLTAANLHLGASIFQKQAGRLPFSTRALLAPVLFGQWLSLRHYSRHCRAWDEVAPYVWIGRVLSDAEAREAIARGVTAVLDLTGEFSEAGPFRTLRYRNLPILDLTAPSAEQLGEMSTFIARQAERGIVYVHCKIGYSRSAAAVGAFLIEHHGMSVDEALARLREARPSIIVRPEIVHALHTYAERIRPSPIADSAPLNSSTGS